jgi:transketolase
MDFIGMNDTFGTSGKADELLEFYHLTEENIIMKVKELIKQK